MERMMIGVGAALVTLGAMAAAPPPQGDADIVMIDGQPYHRYEWRASTYARSAQAEADLGVDASGRIVTVWSSRRQQSGRYGIYGQVFDKQGRALGSETCLNLWTDSHQQAPAVAVDASGRTWVAWRSHGQDGSDGAIIARRLNRVLVGTSEFLVNATPGGHQTDPVVAAGADGRAFVAWTSQEPGRPSRVRALVLGTDGQALGAEARVGLQDDRPARSPGVATDPQGGFVLVYAVSDAENRSQSILLERFTVSGGRRGEAVALSDPDATGPVEPVIASAGEGFVVAWHERAGDRYGTITRRVDARGCPIGEAVAVGPGAAGSHSAAAVAAAPDGRFAVAFNGDDGDGSGVFAQLYAADGSTQGSCFRLTRRVEGTQALRAAAGTRRLALRRDGSLVCAWAGEAGLGDDSSVNVTMLSPKALRPAVRGITEAMPAAEPPERPPGGGPMPHEPPTFDPRRAEEGTREVVHGLTDVGFTGIINTGWIPPDPHLAAGPTHVVLITNGQIAFFTKDGTPTFQDQIEGPAGFWGVVGATEFVFDPEVLYDQLSGRFFAMAAEAFAPGDRSYVLIAVSDDSNPNGTWHTYRFETTAWAGDVLDSPNIGVDEEAVYVTGDGVGGVRTYPVLIYDKASLLSGVPPAASNALTIPTSTLSAGIPPVGFDDPPALYLIEHTESGNNTAVRLIAVQDPLGTPFIADSINLSVPAYGRPEDPPQMGTTVRPEAFDARFWSVAYRNGSLWATHHINAERVLARWYEIAMNGWPDSGQLPTLVQSGQIDPGPEVRTFFSSITVDAHGNATMAFARSAPDEFISMATAHRYASDPLGTFGAPVARKTSTGPYVESRWGDYGAVNIDPADGLTRWAHHEYADGDSWRTWVAGFTPPFDEADLDFDGMVGVGDLLILLGAWGLCPDPPAPCPADIDGDGDVTTVDLLTLLAHWG